MSDIEVPPPIPDVATALAEAHAVDQRLFQFLIDVDDVDLREDTIQAQLCDSNARDATVVVVADVHSLAFTRAATRLADAIGGALADLERALPGAVVVFITIEQAINHRLGLSLTAESEACTAAGAQDESASVPTTTPCCSAAMRTLATDLVRTGQQAVRAPNLFPFRHTHLPNLINECFRWSGCAESPARFNVS